jgi:hypothetical protein
MRKPGEMILFDVRIDGTLRDFACCNTRSFTALKDEQIDSRFVSMVPIIFHISTSTNPSPIRK